MYVLRVEKGKKFFSCIILFYYFNFSSTFDAFDGSCAGDVTPSCKQSADEENFSFQIRPLLATIDVFAIVK